VGFRVVSDLVAHASAKGELTTVLKFGVKLSFGTQKYVPLHTPMVCEITRCVLNHPHANFPEVLSSPISEPRDALVFGSPDL
jgi:hypothetical protein